MCQVGTGQLVKGWEMGLIGACQVKANIPENIAVWLKKNYHTASLTLTRPGTIFLPAIYSQQEAASIN